MICIWPQQCWLSMSIVRSCQSSVLFGCRAKPIQATHFCRLQPCIGAVPTSGCHVAIGTDASPDVSGLAQTSPNSLPARCSSQRVSMPRTSTRERERESLLVDLDSHFSLDVLLSASAWSLHEGLPERRGGLKKAHALRPKQLWICGKKKKENRKQHLDIHRPHF